MAACGCLFLIAGARCTNPNNSERVVGFDIVKLYRPGINYHKDSVARPGRPVFIRLWYPASKPEDSTVMEYGIYIKSLTSENNTGDNDHDLSLSTNTFSRHIRAFNDLDSAATFEGLANLSRTRTSAYLEALPYDTISPLVFVSGGNPVYHIFLIEQLAQHGFVVASIPRLGVKEGERLAFNSEGAKVLTDDILFAVDELKKYQYIDGNDISLIAWSYEGVPSLLAAEALGEINCLISLDASIGYQYGSSLVTDSVVFSANQFTFPLVHFTGPGFTYGKSLELLSKLNAHSDVVVVEVPGMVHANFTSLSSLIIPEIFSNTAANLSYLNIVERCVPIIHSGGDLSTIRKLIAADSIFSIIDLASD